MNKVIPKQSIDYHNLEVGLLAHLFKSYNMVNLYAYLIEHANAIRPPLIEDTSGYMTIPRGFTLVK